MCSSDVKPKQTRSEATVPLFTKVDFPALGDAVPINVAVFYTFHHHRLNSVYSLYWQDL